VNDPLAYFITFHTYGSWLHGDLRGSVDRTHNAYGENFVERSQAREAFESNQMKRPEFVLEPEHRFVVNRTIREVAQHRKWRLHALHVRTNHVHLVITAVDVSPERVLNDLKSWCTRRLRESGIIQADSRVWSRHGSTRYLWKEEQIAEKVEYTANGQGAPLPMRAPRSKEHCSEPRP